MHGLADMLQTYGGWGVAGVCMFVILRLYKDNQALHRDQKEETRETVTALIETREAMQSFRDAMGALVKELRGPH